jgi:hypothetical protein
MKTPVAPLPTTVKPWLRASDDDRQRVVDELQCATVAGRLTLDEFAIRAEAAHRAITYGDLAPLIADLPTTPARSRTTASPATIALAAAGIALLALVTVLLAWWLTGGGNGDMMEHMGGMMH